MNFASLISLLVTFVASVVRNLVNCAHYIKCTLLNAYCTLPSAQYSTFFYHNVHLFPSNLGGRAHILEIVQQNSTIRHRAQLNENSASISSQ